MNLASLFTNHPFWGVLTLAVLLWYSTITIYVGVRGFADIKQMLRHLKQNEDRERNQRPDFTPPSSQ